MYLTAESDESDEDLPSRKAAFFWLYHYKLPLGTKLRLILCPENAYFYGVSPGPPTHADPAAFKTRFLQDLEKRWRSMIPEYDAPKLDMSNTILLEDWYHSGDWKKYMDESDFMERFPMMHEDGETAASMDNSLRSSMRSEVLGLDVTYIQCNFTSDSLDSESADVKMHMMMSQRFKRDRQYTAAAGRRCFKSLLLPPSVQPLYCFSLLTYYIEPEHPA